MIRESARLSERFRMQKFWPGYVLSLNLPDFFCMWAIGDLNHYFSLTFAMVTFRAQNFTVGRPRGRGPYNHFSSRRNPDLNNNRVRPASVCCLGFARVNNIVVTFLNCLNHTRQDIATENR